MGTYYHITPNKQFACSSTLNNAIYKCEELDADTSDEEAYFSYSVTSTTATSGITSIDLHDYVLNVAALPTGKDDGYKADVMTNKLTYEVIDGAYAIRNYCIDVETSADFGSLTEMEDRQKVYIEEIDKKYMWDTSAWHEIHTSGGSSSTVTASGSNFTPQTGWSVLNLAGNIDRSADPTDTQQATADSHATLVNDLINAGILSP